MEGEPQGLFASTGYDDELDATAAFSLDFVEVSVSSTSCASASPEKLGGGIEMSNVGTVRRWVFEIFPFGKSPPNSSSSSMANIKSPVEPFGLKAGLFDRLWRRRDDPDLGFWADGDWFKSSTELALALSPPCDFASRS